MVDDRFDVTHAGHMAERQALQMIARQIKTRAAEGHLALDRAMITEVALPGEQLQSRCTRVHNKVQVI